MLNGVATVTYFTADLPAATRWYTDVLGIEPYYAVEGYVEFRIGDYSTELGLIDSRYVPHAPATPPAGAIPYWQVDDLEAAVDRLVAHGAVEHEARTERGQGTGFVTASVVDPFGNILGVMANPHYVEVRAARRA
jgi:catechol 2,3-dioxygenase-like lactoylglutathione lyase family enzyme